MHVTGLILPIIALLAVIGILIGVGYLFILLGKALRKYIHIQEIRQEKTGVKKALGVILKENRTRCKMTQEFVAESLAVSRQAVSKWENGTSEPSMSNLIALTNVYGTTVEELLRQVKSDKDDAQNKKNI